MSFSLVEEADPTTTKTKKNRNDCGMKVVIFLAQKKNKKDEKKWLYYKKKRCKKNPKTRNLIPMVIKIEIIQVRLHNFTSK